MRDFSRRERVGNVEHSHTRILVGGEDPLLALRLPRHNVRLAPSPGTIAIVDPKILTLDPPATLQRLRKGRHEGRHESSNATGAIDRQSGVSSNG
jgi:hypothetical protein